MNRGGKRAGAGRKATGRKANVAKLIYLSDEDIENISIIKEYGQKHISQEIKDDSKAIRYALHYTALKLLLNQIKS